MLPWAWVTGWPCLTWLLVRCSVLCVPCISHRGGSGTSSRARPSPRAPRAQAGRVGWGAPVLFTSQHPHREESIWPLCFRCSPPEAMAASALHLLQPWGSLGGWRVSRGSTSEFLRRSLNGPAKQRGLLQPLVRMRDPGNVAAALPPLRCPAMPTDDPQGWSRQGRADTAVTPRT